MPDLENEPEPENLPADTGAHQLENDRHERFSLEYLKDLNATAAYRRVYPDAGKYSAEVGGPRLLGNVRVAARIAHLQAERAERLELESDAILRELMVLGFSNVEHYEVDDLGHVSLAPGVPKAAMRAISSIKHRIVSNGDFTSHEVELKLWNKNGALELLGRHLGLFPNKYEHGGPGGGPIPVEFTFDLSGGAGPINDRVAEHQRQLEAGNDA